MPRSIKKGPFVDLHLAKKSRAGHRQQHEASDQDLVAAIDGDAGHDRSHDLGA